MIISRSVMLCAKIGHNVKKIDFAGNNLRMHSLKLLLLQERETPSRVHIASGDG